MDRWRVIIVAIIVVIGGWFFFYHGSGGDSSTSGHGKNGATVPVGVATAKPVIFLFI